MVVSRRGTAVSTRSLSRRLLRTGVASSSRPPSAPGRDRDGHTVVAVAAVVAGIVAGVLAGRALLPVPPDRIRVIHRALTSHTRGNTHIRAHHPLPFPARRSTLLLCAAVSDPPLPFDDGRSGNFFRTAARTCAFSAGVPFAATRASAATACV